MQMSGSNHNQLLHSKLTSTQTPTSHPSLTSLPTSCEKPYRSDMSHLFTFRHAALYAPRNSPAFTVVHLLLMCHNTVHMLPPISISPQIIHHSGSYSVVITLPSKAFHGETCMSVSTPGLRSPGMTKNYVFFILVAPNMHHDTQ